MKNQNTNIIFLLVLIFASFTSCNNNKISRSEKYGGTFRINTSDVPDIIFPGQVLKASEQLIINQVYVGLLKYNPRNIEIEPSLAKNWRIERNKTLYTFYLHNNAYFQKDACFIPNNTRKIVAQDVKYSIEQIARFHVLNQHEISSQLANIIGSETILESNTQNDSLHISGIEAVNDTTIIFQLKEPDLLFVHYLASTNSLVFAHEAYKAYGFKNTVASGAYSFYYPKIKGHAMTLIANPTFFRKNKQNQQLPFVDTIVVSFITSPPKELMLFEQGILDIVTNIDGKYVTSFLDKHIDKFQSNPPYYIMKQTPDAKKNLKYSFIRSNVQNIEVNSIGYFDFSEIYLKPSIVQEINVY